MIRVRRQTRAVRRALTIHRRGAAIVAASGGYGLEYGLEYGVS